MQIRGLKVSLNSNLTYKYKEPEGVVDFLVVGGGVVGLAVARLLCLQFPEKSVYLIERNGRPGEETSSRNSEVIHAGLYYPPKSLKESLCLRGRHLLYQYCKVASIPFRKTGKLVVAHEHQRPYVESLYEKTRRLEWPDPIHTSPSILGDDYPPSSPALPSRILTGDQARELEPDLSPDIVSALLSPETGIIDSHTYMESLERDIAEAGNGYVVCRTSAVRVDPYYDSRSEDSGWVVQTVTRSTEESDSQKDAFLARTLINSSGLSGNLILNSLLSRNDRIPMYYARGSYAAYSGNGVSRVSHLLYPCPDAGKAEHAFQSLGTHLTLDLSGNVRFGPDLQWISPNRSHGNTSRTQPEPSPIPTDEDKELLEDFSFDESDVDFWKEHLVPDDSQLEAMYHAVKSYLPDVDGNRFRPDYVGIRPKLVPPWGGFQDFVFRTDRSSAFKKYDESDTRYKIEKGGLMVTLMGIESPGLTSSLAIAEKVLDVIGTGRAS